MSSADHATVPRLRPPMFSDPAAALFSGRLRFKEEVFPSRPIRLVPGASSRLGRKWSSPATKGMRAAEPSHAPALPRQVTTTSTAASASSRPPPSPAQNAQIGQVAYGAGQGRGQWPCAAMARDLMDVGSRVNAIPPLEPRHEGSELSRSAALLTDSASRQPTPRTASSTPAVTAPRERLAQLRKLWRFCQHAVYHRWRLLGGHRSTPSGQHDHRRRG